MTKRIIRTQEKDDGIWDLIAYNDDPADLRGYWVRREESWKQELRVPLACGACGSLLFNIDTQYVHRYGVCGDCYITFLEGRENLPNFKDNSERTKFCKERFEEKNARNKQDL